MTIPLDNAVIDFNTIHGIYSTLANHQDVFSALENKSVVKTFDNTSGGPSNSVLNVASMQIVTVRMVVPLGSQTIAFPANFSSAPAVTVTIEATNNTGAQVYVAEITQNGDGKGSFGSVTIYTYDTLGKSKTGNVIANLIAIGQSA